MLRYIEGGLSCVGSQLSRDTAQEELQYYSQDSFYFSLSEKRNGFSLILLYYLRK